MRQTRSDETVKGPNEDMDDLILPESDLDDSHVSESSQYDTDVCSSPPNIDDSLPIDQPMGDARDEIAPAGILDVDAAERLRCWLREKGFDPSEEPHLLTDSYIHVCLTRSKNGKVRSFEYAASKLLESLQWRKDYGAAHIQYSDVARSLAPNHMLWNGFDRLGRPILYVRPALLDFSTYDRDEYVRAHVFLLEQGLKMMPPGVTTFLLVADASGLGMKHLDIALMRRLLQVVTVAYPDRLGQLVVGPANMVVRCAWAALSRLMSRSMAAKICIVKDLRPRLLDLLPAGAEPPPLVQ